MIRVQFCAFIVLLLVSVVLGATSFSPIETTEQHGKTVKFCSYNGVRMLRGSRILDFDTCMKCQCRKSGLDCATMSSAFTINVPSDSKCISVLVGCKNRWVMRNNTKRRCPKGLIPTENISMVGK